jgi:predicted membrane-bound spermidine synthase
LYAARWIPAAVGAIVGRVTRLSLLGASLFLSSLGALLDQVVWERMIGLSTGVDAVSAAIVVSTFLFGAGLGNLAATVLAGRLSVPASAAVYALAHGATAVYAWSSPWLFYDWLFQRFAAAHPQAAVLAASFGLLLPPTIAMGLALPLACQLAGAVAKDVPRSVARLVGLDLAGAAAGAGLATWWLMGRLGLASAVRAGTAATALAGALGLLAAAGAGGLARRPGRLPDEGARSPWRWFLLLFAAGAVTVSLEMVWLRYFGVILQASTYAFGHVLMVILLFDGLGAMLAGQARLDVDQPRRTFLLLQALAILVATAGLWAAATPVLAPLAEWSLEDLQPLSWWLTLGFLPLVLIAPSAVVIGLLFPLAQRAAYARREAVGREVAILHFGLILGNATGGLVTGLVLLDRLGTPATLRLLLGFAAACALAALVPAPPSRRLRAAAGLLLAAGLLAAWYLPGRDRFWPGVDLLRDPAVARLVAEDASGVAILEGGRSAMLLIQGRRNGHIPPTETHVALGALGVLLHPDPRRVFILGLGSGGSAWAAGCRGSVASVEAVEIAGASVEVLRRHRSRWESPVLGRVLSDPRFSVRVADGRRELMRARRRFDVIQADAISPQASHSGSLYSLEFLELARSRLEPGGLMVQWCPTERVRATFRRAFPYGADLGPFLVGSSSPLRATSRDLAARLALPEVQDWFRSAGVAPPPLGRPFVAWGPGSAPPGPPAEVNRDMFPRDEFYVSGN